MLTVVQKISALFGFKEFKKCFRYEAWRKYFCRRTPKYDGENTEAPQQSRLPIS